MPRLLFLLGTFFFSMFNIFGQYQTAETTGFELSKPYHVVDAKHKRYFHHNGEVLAVKVTGSRITVQKLDPNAMQEILRKELMMNEPSHLEHIKKFGDKILVFYSIWDKINLAEQLFYREIDFQTGEWKGDPINIVTSSGKIKNRGIQTHFLSDAFWQKFYIYFSQGDSTFLVQYRLAPVETNDALNFDKIGLHVFNTNMQKVWGKEVEMPYTEEKMDILSYTVDQKGNAYMVIDVIQVKERYPNRFELLKCNALIENCNHWPIDLEVEYAAQAGVFETSNGKLILAGIYTENDLDGDQEGGLFYDEVTAKGLSKKLKTVSIPKKICLEYEAPAISGENSPYKSGRLSNLDIKKIIMNKDGSLVFIAEQIYQTIVIHSSTSASSVGSTVFDNFDNLLMIKLNTNGQAEWFRKIPKRQMEIARRNSTSFQHYYLNGVHHLVFLDLAKNAGVSPKRVPYTIEFGNFGSPFDFISGNDLGAVNLVDFIVDDNLGAVKRMDIMDVSRPKGYKFIGFSLAKVTNVSKSQLIFEVYKKKKEDVFVKIDLGKR